MVLDSHLLNLIVCPVCQANLTYDKVTQELICATDQVAFPIQDGIPIMLVEVARTLRD